MLWEPWESEKVVLTGNLVSPVGRSPVLLSFRHHAGIPVVFN